MSKCNKINIENLKLTLTFQDKETCAKEKQSIKFYIGNFGSPDYPIPALEQECTIYTNKKNSSCLEIKIKTPIDAFKIFAVLLYIKIIDFKQSKDILKSVVSQINTYEALEDAADMLGFLLDEGKVTQQQYNEITDSKEEKQSSKKKPEQTPFGNTYINNIKETGSLGPQIPQQGLKTI